MGLDLYHLQATDDQSASHVVVDPEASEFHMLKDFFREKDNEYIDWKAMFGSKGLVFEDYAVTNTTLSTSDSLFQRGKLLQTTSFTHRLNVHDMVVFTTASAPLLRWPRGRSAVKTVHGPFTYRTQRDNVVHVVQIGYQRNDVTDAFYEEFPPDLTSGDAGQVRRLAELVTAEARPEFMRQFIDNWQDGRSVLVVSW